MHCKLAYNVNNIVMCVTITHSLPSSAMISLIAYFVWSASGPDMRKQGTVFDRTNIASAQLQFFLIVRTLACGKH